MLRQASEHFLLTLDEQKTSEAKLQRVVDLGTDELKEVRQSGGRSLGHCAPLTSQLNRS